MCNMQNMRKRNKPIPSQEIILALPPLYILSFHS